MERHCSWTRALAGGLFLIAALAGCTHAPPDPRAPDFARLHNAIQLDDVEYIRAAVKAHALGVNQRIPAPVYMEGTPLITIAARDASLRVMEYLIAAGADVNAQTPAGETALMLATFFYERSSRHEQAVRMLVNAGASVENEPHHYTPLAYAAYQGNERIVRFLLERGARVDADASEGLIYVNTPLMMAVIQGHREIALYLLRAGADPRVRIQWGHTAAELAAKYRHADLLRTLRCAEMLVAGVAARCE